MCVSVWKQGENMNRVVCAIIIITPSVFHNAATVCNDYL